MLAVAGVAAISAIVSAITWVQGTFGGGVDLGGGPGPKGDVAWDILVMLWVFRLFRCSSVNREY